MIHSAKVLQGFFLLACIFVSMKTYAEDTDQPAMTSRCAYLIDRFTGLAPLAADGKTVTPKKVASAQRGLALEAMQTSDATAADPYAETRILVKRINDLLYPGARDHSDLPAPRGIGADRSRAINLALRMADVQLNCEEVDLIEKRYEREETDMRKLETQIQTAVRELGPKYKPLNMITKENAVAAAYAQGIQGQWGALAKIAIDDMNDSCSSRNRADKVAERQDKLWIALIPPLLAGKFNLKNRELRAALVNVNLSSKTGNSDPLLRYTYDTLIKMVGMEVVKLDRRKAPNWLWRGMGAVKKGFQYALAWLFRWPIPEPEFEESLTVAETATIPEGLLLKPLTPEESSAIQECLRNCFGTEKRYEEVTRRFVELHEAAVESLDTSIRLTRPNGDDLLDEGNFVRQKIWENVNLDHYIRLKETVLTYLSDRNSYFDPVTGREIFVKAKTDGKPLNLKEAFRNGDLGKDFEMLIAAQILGQKAVIEAEYRRRYIYRLQAEWKNVQAQSPKLAKDIEDGLVVMATDAIKKFSSSTSALPVSVQPLWNILTDKLQDNKETKAQAEVAKKGEDKTLPASFPGYLRLESLQLPEKQRKALSTLLEAKLAIHLIRASEPSTPEAVAAATPPAERTYKAHEVSSFLMWHLEALNEWADDIFKEYYKTRVQNLENMTLLDFDAKLEVRRQRRQLVNSLLRIRAAIANCLRDEKLGNEDDVEATLDARMRGLLDLQTILMSETRIVEIAGLRNRIAIRNAQREFPREDQVDGIRVSALNYVTAKPWRMGLAAAILAAASATGGYEATKIKSLWADKPPETPAITAPESPLKIEPEKKKPADKPPQGPLQIEPEKKEKPDKP